MKELSLYVIQKNINKNTTDTNTVHSKYQKEEEHILDDKTHQFEEEEI